eukprot:scpid27462/ scgid35300/ 
MSSTSGGNKKRSSVRGPFEPGDTGGLSYLSGKSLDKCFSEVLRAVLFGLGTSRPENVPLSREDLFLYICSVLHIDQHHAQALLQQVSADVPEQALDVQVIQAENVAETSTGANTCMKLFLVNVQEHSKQQQEHAAASAGLPADPTLRPSAITEIQENNANPKYEQDFSIDLESVDGMGLLVEIWAYPGSGAQPVSREETGMLKRFLNRLASQASIEEGMVASLLLPLHQLHPLGEPKWYTMKSMRNVATRCQLHISFVPDKISREGGSEVSRASEDVSVQYRTLTRAFLDHQLSQAKEKGEEFVRTDQYWYRWCHQSGDILARYCQQHHISKLQQMALSVEAVAQMHRCHPMPTRALIYFCQQLQDTFAGVDSIQECEKIEMKRCLDDLVNFIFGRFSVSNELFPPRKTQLEEISDFVNMLHSLQRSELWSAFLPDRTVADVANQAKLTMQVRIKAWYLASVEFSMGFCNELPGLTTISQKMVTVLSSFLESFRDVNQSYLKLFAGFDLSYEEVCLEHFHTLLVSDLDKFTKLAKATMERIMKSTPLSTKNRQLLSTVCKLLQKLFGLTLQLERRLLHTSTDTERSTTACHVYFERLVPVWMKQLRLEAEDQVHSALANEKLQVVSSSSPGLLASADTVITYIEQLEVLWTDICKWPEPVVAFLACARVLDVIADVARLYIQRITHLVPTWNLRKETSRRAIGRKVGLVLSSLSSFQSLLKSSPAWIDWQQCVDNLKRAKSTPSSSSVSSSATPTQPEHNRRSGQHGSHSSVTSLPEVADGIDVMVGTTLMSAAYSDAQRLLRRAVHTIVKELTAVQLPDTIYQVIQSASHQDIMDSEVYDALFSWLKETTALFLEGTELDSDIRAIVLLEIWDRLHQEFLSAVSGQHQGKHDVFRKLYNGLVAPNGLLTSVIGLSAKVASFPHDAFNTTSLCRVKHVLLVEGCPTMHLMAFHYSELLTYPHECGAGEHGDLQVFSQLQNTSLTIEVRSAKKLNAINGVCNSYIIVEFHPTSFFVSNTSLRCQPIINRTSPIYDFKIDTTVSGDMPEYSVAVITAMHSLSPRQDDVLLGQAVLPLSSVASRQTRADLHLLLCNSSIMQEQPNVYLHALSTLHRRVTSDVDAGTLAAVLDKTMEMASTSKSMLRS